MAEMDLIRLPSLLATIPLDRLRDSSVIQEECFWISHEEHLESEPWIMKRETNKQYNRSSTKGAISLPYIDI